MLTCFKLHFQDSVDHPLPELKVKQEPGLCLSEALSTVTTTTITTTSVSSVMTATTTATNTTVTPAEIKTEIKPPIKYEFMKEEFIKEEEIIKSEYPKQDIKLELSDMKSELRADIKDEPLTLPQVKEEPIETTNQQQSPESTTSGNPENINGGDTKANALGGPLAPTTPGSSTPPKSKKGNPEFFCALFFPSFDCFKNKNYLLLL